MGEKDITEKILEDHNDVFADIINGLIFAGEQRILPESLENTAVHSQYKADDEKVHELERDVAKYWKDQDVQLAICGIENQSSVEKYMPFRIIGYDGTAYRSQLQDKRKEILPVMTIVLYFGTEHRWYGKRNIKGLMKIPEGLDDYINDYKMQVFEVAWLTEEQISRFRSDFKIVANFFVQKRKNKDYIPDDPTEIKHIDEVLKLLQVMTGDEHYKEVIRKKKGVRIFHALVCLIVIGFISVGREFIGLLYEHGEFSSQAATSVYICMSIYVFDQQNNIVRDLVYRYFFAFGETKITVKNGVITSTVNIIFSLILSQFLGVYGIILGTYVAGLVSLCCIILRLKKTYGFQVKMRDTLKEFLKTELAVFLTIISVIILKNSMPTYPYIISFLIYGAISVIIYITCIFVAHKKLLTKYI